MDNKYVVRKWKLPIIRWAMRQIAPLMPAMHGTTYETLARFGIDDLYKDPHTGEIALYPSAEHYEPEQM